MNLTHNLGAMGQSRLRGCKEERAREEGAQTGAGSREKGARRREPGRLQEGRVVGSLL